MRPLASRLRTLSLVLALAAFPSSAPAWADGAFPDSLGVFAPPGKSLVLSSNFGLLVSDDGTKFHWICEAVTGTNASLYQVGADGTAYAVSGDGLRRGGDGYCGWEHAGGMLANAAAADVFPDPDDPLHVLALARPVNPDNSYGPLGLYESRDGAKTFGAPLTTSPANSDFTGVEVARGSHGQTVYLTLVAVGSPLHPYVLRSTDGGAHFDTFDVQSTLGNRRIRLAAVDPENPSRLYVRATDLKNPADPDTLAISDDGGATFRIPTRPDGSPLGLVYPMTAFLRRANGQLLIGVGAAPAPASLFSSTDGGQTFSPVPNAPHVRALAERDGIVYAATDDQRDGFALARSSDGGATWEAILGFNQICGPLACGGIPDTCAGDWDRIKLTVGIPEDACGESTTTTPPAKKGCGCSETGAAGLSGLVVLALGLRARSARRSS